MKDGVFIFLLGNLLVVLALAIRAAYAAHRLASYLLEQHPEKAREFGCCHEEAPHDGFRFMRELYRKHEIEDPEFMRLKAKARSAATWTVLTLLPMSLFIILILITALFFGR
jgi:flagellar biogenesis protein FliO